MGDREDGYWPIGGAFVICGLLFFSYFLLFGFAHVLLFSSLFFVSLLLSSFIVMLLGIVLFFRESLMLVRVSGVLFGYLVFFVVVWFSLVYGFSAG